MSSTFRKVFSILALLTSTLSAAAQEPAFRVLAFFTGKSDLAHISFVEESYAWFQQAAKQENFVYDTTRNWDDMRPEVLATYQVVVFLDTRPEKPAQREAFRQYMENGGAWLGFHFSAFALTPSAFPQNWDWYHNTFLGSGEYGSNTWRPTSAFLKVDDTRHPVVQGLPAIIKASPNEWYRWKNDLRKNPDIDVLLSVDSSSFPLGTGPKQHEIWHSGDYPVVWTNKKFRMLYVNMGHNDMDYGGTNSTLSYTFGNPEQDRLILHALRWLGAKW
ncbi:ThuA domain-containing protein [Chitinophaga lutea]